MFHNLKVRNFLNFMTAATIIVVIKFSVYNLPSTKKINDSAVYFLYKQSPERYLPDRAVVNYAIFKKIFSTDLYSKCSRLHKTSVKTSKV